MRSIVIIMIVFLFCFITDEYSARDVGFYDELPLAFHKGDKINIINIKNGNKKI